MTSVMRAATRPVATRALRAALVRGGRILDERVLPLGEHLTVGPTERSTFVVAGLPSSVRLLEWSRAGYQLQLGAGMSARLSIGGEITEVSGRAKAALDDASRGRVIAGDTVVLFHFVEPEVAVARPELPLAARQGMLDGLDWKTTCIAAFSFLFHFGALGAAYSDFADTTVEDDGAWVTQAVESLRDLPSPPAVEVPANDATNGSTPAPAPEARPGRSVSPGPRHAVSTGPSVGGREAAGDARARDIARQLDAEGGMVLAGIGGTNGGATGVVLEHGTVPTGILDGVAGDAHGTRTGGDSSLNISAGSVAVRPGEGSHGLPGSVDRKRDERADDLGIATGPKKPVATATVAPPDVSGGSVPDAGHVVGGLKGMLKACYRHALDEDPTMHGTVRVTAKIGPNGEVRSVQAANAGLSSSMVGCVSRVVSGAQFAPPAGGGAVLSIPMSFIPQ